MNYLAKKISLVAFFIALSLSVAVAQGSQQHEHEELPSTINNPNKMKHRAKHALRMGDAYTALFYYEKIVDADTSDLDAMFQLAELYRITRNYHEAEKAYARVYKKAPNTYTIAHYYEGVMLKMDGKPKEAKEHLMEFKREGRNIGSKEFKRHLYREIAGCDSAIIFKEFPDNVKINNAGSEVNHPHIEFSPVLQDSTKMIFGSLVLDSLHFYDISYDHYEKQPNRQLYQVTKENGQWGNKKLYDVLNDTSMHMGDFAFSPSGKRLYYTKCSKNQRGEVTCKIYMSTISKGKIQPGELLPAPVNIDGYNSTQPAVAYDTTKKRDYLYFVSDRPDGKGGMDIWYTFYYARKREWYKPINLGGFINTPDTECTPFYDQNTGDFYFSSEGHPTMGGFDVFKTHKNGRRWERAKNLGYPINSAQDDIGFYLGADGKKGMLVSNRRGGTPYFHETCCDDIYEFEILPPKPFNCDLHLAVKDDSSDCEGKLLQIFIEDLKTGNVVKKDTLLSSCNYQLPLDRRHKYSFTIQQEGYENDTLSFTTRDQAASDELNKELKLKLIKKPVLEIPKVKPTEEKPFVLKDVHYETNKAELTPEAKKSLREVLVPYLKSHPDLVAIIASHTDHVGSKKYNQDLSQRRAENVVKFLISEGVSKDHLEAVGHGENKPIAPNKNPDGTDNPIGMSINRRTEFSFKK